MGGIINNRQALHHAAICSAVEDKIHRSDPVRRSRPTQRTAIRNRDLLALATPNLKTFRGIKPVNALTVHQKPLLPQFQVDHIGAIPPVPMSQCDNAFA